MLRKLDEASKRQAARQRIEEMIRTQNLWGRRLKSERSLAAELGIARRTLQAALAELQAERLVERRHGAGTFAAERPAARSSRRTARLAVIAAQHWEASTDWAYTAEILRGVLGYAPKVRAEAEVFALSEPAEAEQVGDAARMRGFDGFVSVAQNDRSLVTHLLRLQRGPVVLVDDVIRDLPVTCVVDGSFEGMRAVTRHVLRLGHRRVALLDCHNRDAINPEKHAGYCAALREKDLDPDPELVAVPPRRVHSDPSEGTEFSALVEADVRRLLALAEPPTAIVAFDDSYALAAMRELERRGLRVGEDICLAGHGDAAIRRGLSDQLTSCRTYPHRMGEAAARAALEPGTRGEARTIIVPNRLYIRKSTCPPSHRSGGEPCSPGEGVCRLQGGASDRPATQPAGEERQS
jgi:DNA-binding LacI/PurR family transcriptional regulator